MVSARADQVCLVFQIVRRESPTGKEVESAQGIGFLAPVNETSLSSGDAKVSQPDATIGDLGGSRKAASLAIRSAQERQEARRFPNTCFLSEARLRRQCRKRKAAGLRTIRQLKPTRTGRTPHGRRK
jgi:hypothetical protein